METPVITRNDLYLNILNSIDFKKIVDHPNILIAANFWDAERYQAARDCYKFMRAIDDLIDNYKTEHVTISAENQSEFEAHVSDWINTVIETKRDIPSHRELIETVSVFVFLSGRWKPLPNR